jgi:rhamnogalacturonyl hydrolase YesR
MSAAFLKAQQAGAGGNFRPLIDGALDYISTKQFRLADGTLARHRPMPTSVWLDDDYMSVPALAQMGRLTGDVKYFDDAARQVRQFAKILFIPEKGLYAHGWVQEMEDHPHFLWGRANGWAAMSEVELLSVLPESHPGFAPVLAQLRAHLRGLAAAQGVNGLWHQLLDHPETYEETSCSAMFVFAAARAINRGWIDAAAYGPMASLGWNAVARKVNAQGQVEGTCVGTGMSWDPMFYAYRPTSVYAAHGYGPVLLAGAEMIALRNGKGAGAGLHDDGVHFVKPAGPGVQ